MNLKFNLKLFKLLSVEKKLFIKKFLEPLFNCLTLLVIKNPRKLFFQVIYFLKKYDRIKFQYFYLTKVFGQTLS